MIDLTCPIHATAPSLLTTSEGTDWTDSTSPWSTAWPVLTRRPSESRTTLTSAPPLSTPNVDDANAAYDPARRTSPSRVRSLALMLVCPSVVRRPVRDEQP